MTGDRGMNPNEINIRTAGLDDAEEILRIYAPYVTKTAITFEYEVPDLREWEERMKRTLKRYPYLVAEKNGILLGYAYTGPFIGRSAYDWSAEVSIYVREDQKGKGVGKILYHALEEISKAQNIRNLNACIGYPETEDQYLTKNSVQFHEHMGYQLVGEFHQCGYKFGTWYNMVWMEKKIGPHGPEPLPVLAFPDFDPEELRRMGIHKNIFKKYPSPNE